LCATVGATFFAVDGASSVKASSSFSSCGCSLRFLLSPSLFATDEEEEEEVDDVDDDDDDDDDDDEEADKEEEEVEGAYV